MAWEELGTLAGKDGDDAALPPGLITSASIQTVVTLTEAQYSALGAKSDTTLYLVV